MLSFDIPEHISFFTHRVLLACRGWCSDIQLEYRAKQIIYRIGLVHYCWHGTLSQVHIHSMGTIENKKIDEIILILNKEIEMLHEKAVYLWDTYSDSVPGWTHQDGFFIDKYETQKFKNFTTTHVVHPERARPQFILPGWSNCETISEYLKFIMHNNHLDIILTRLINNNYQIKWSDQMDYFKSYMEYNKPQTWKFNGLFYISIVKDKLYSHVGQKNTFSITSENIHNDTIAPVIKAIGDITFSNILKLENNIPVQGLDVYKEIK